MGLKLLLNVIGRWDLVNLNMILLTSRLTIFYRSDKIFKLWQCCANIFGILLHYC